ncbi:MAG: hypothetical protein KatS3mg119_0517 [Rhodothalassiaceae bacterium]|nr:MAG: hypothetical protein KatS3mg119_0517 [Rhodothalassiaceae bacterium]
MPARENIKLSTHEQYPAWLEKRDRVNKNDLGAFCPVRATFELEQSDLEAVANVLGEGVLSSATLVLERRYNGDLIFMVQTEEVAAVRNLVDMLELPKSYARRARSINSLEDLRKLATELSDMTEDTDATAAGAALLSKIDEVYGTRGVEQAARAALEQRVPKFFYFSEYSTLPYKVVIQRVLREEDRQLTDGELTARSLLRMAAAEGEYLLDSDYERRKRELENVANALTDDVLRFWSQNPELRVHPDIERRTATTPPGSDADELKIRIWDNRHQLSLPIDEHSSGFRWFFSFLAAFSEYEFAETPVVIFRWTSRPWGCTRGPKRTS